MRAIDKVDLNPSLLPQGRTDSFRWEEERKLQFRRFFLQYASFKPISPGMKHDSISKDLKETSLSASPQTELFRFICGTNGKMIFKSVQF